MTGPTVTPAWRQDRLAADGTAEDALLLRRALDAVQDGDLPGARALLDAAGSRQINLDEVFRLYQLEIEAQAQQLQDSQARMEQALAWFANLFRNLPVAAMLIDTHGLLVDANTRAVDDLALHGTLRTHPLPLRRLIADAAGESRLSALLQASADGTIQSMDDLPMRTLDGQARWADLRITQVPPRAGEAGAPLFLCVLNDRTIRVESLRAREAIARAEHERDLALAASRNQAELLSRVSHELRTPLNAVIGFSSLMLMDADTLPAPERQRIGHILTAGQHLLGLVDDILQINQARIGYLRLDTQCVRLRPIAQEVLDLQEPSLRNQDLSVSLTADEGLDDRALADPRRVHEVVSNLVSNAIKYNRPGGWLGLHLRDHGQQLLVEVGDSGVGMGDEQLKHLFEPFNRLGAERTKVQGYGLGLSIARSMARAMGGDLTVQSRPGLGSTFTLSLPRASATAVPADGP